MGSPKKAKTTLKKELGAQQKKLPTTQKNRNQAKTIDLKKVQKMGARGLFDYQIAASFGLSPDRFSMLKKERPEISAAILKGKSSAVLKVVNVVYDLAVNERNLDACKFFLKCVGGFKENADPLIHINMNNAYAEEKEEKEIVTYEDAQDTYLDLIRETHEDGGS